jgi:hypothetical protein
MNSPPLRIGVCLRLKGHGSAHVTLCVASLWCRREGFRWHDPEEAINALAAFDQLPTAVKQLKRRDLLFSHALDILQPQLETVRIEEVQSALYLSSTGLRDHQGRPFEYTVAEGETLVLVCDDIKGDTGKVMTDGGGLISLELAKHIEPIQGGSKRLALDDGVKKQTSAPLVTQIRAWLQGYLAKGTLTTAAQLQGQLIVLRREMVKVQPAEVRAGERYHRVCKILACNTFERALQCKSNPSLVALLEANALRKDSVAGKCRQALLELLKAQQADEKRRISVLNVPSEKALERERKDKILRMLSTGSGGRALEMLQAGFSLHEPYLAQLLEKEAANRLSNLCQGKWRLPDSHYVVGVPDQTDSLESDEIVVVIEGKPLQPKLADGGSTDGHLWVLVYHAPGCHPGDLRRFKHVPPPPALHQMLAGGSSERQNAIFFSVRGSQAAADKLGGADYDGDEFVVLTDPKLVELVADAPVRKGPADEPAAKVAEARLSDRAARTLILAGLALDRKYNELDVLAKAAFNIMAQGDWYGADDSLVKGKLVDTYYGMPVSSLRARSAPRTYRPLACLDAFELPLDCLWTIFGPPLDCLWTAFGLPLDCLWTRSSPF